MREESPNILIAFVTFLLSFLGNCDLPEITQTSTMSEPALEIILKASTSNPSEADIALVSAVLAQRLADYAFNLEYQSEGRFRFILPASSLSQQETILALATQRGLLHFQLVAKEVSLNLNPEDLEDPWLDAHIIAEANAVIDDFGGNSVSFEISPEYQEIFAQLTGDNIGRHLAIVLDNTVLIAPVIQSRLTSSGRISGLDSLPEAQALAQVLRSGPLPFDLSIEAVISLSP